MTVLEGIRNRKMCYANYENGKKTEGIELPNLGKIRKFSGKKTYKYLGILGVDTIKLWAMKIFFYKEYRRKLENYTKLNYIAEISLKG